MRTYLWPAIFGLVSGVVVFVLALTGGRLAPRFGGQAFAQVTSLTTLAANIVLLFLAVLALLVAGAAYREAHDSGVRQEKTFAAEQEALNESRQALTAVVGQLNAHRQSLNTALDTLSEQLKVVQQAHEEEKKRVVRRPIVDIRVGEITGAQLDSLIRVDIDPAGYTPIDFVIANTGDADLIAPTVIIQAFPSTVFVDERGLHIIERADHHVLQLSPGDIHQKGEPAHCAVDVKVPPDVNEFTVAVSVFRQGVNATTRNFRFAAGRRLRLGIFRR